MFGLATSQNGEANSGDASNAECLRMRIWMASDLSWAEFWRRQGVDTSTFDGCSTVSTLKGRRGVMCKEKDW